MALPYNLTPAPKLLNRISAPVDLGEFNQDYAGWKVVIDMGVDLKTNEIIAIAADTNASVPDRARAVAAWIERVLIAWNFVDSEGEPLPQPRDGGAPLCPQALIGDISNAVAREISPKKA